MGEVAHPSDDRIAGLLRPAALEAWTVRGDRSDGAPVVRVSGPPPVPLKTPHHDERPIPGVMMRWMRIVGSLGEFVQARIQVCQTGWNGFFKILFKLFLRFFVHRGPTSSTPSDSV